MDLLSEFGIKPSDENNLSATTTTPEHFEVNSPLKFLFAHKNAVLVIGETEVRINS